MKQEKVERTEGDLRQIKARGESKEGKRPQTLRNRLGEAVSISLIAAGVTISLAALALSIPLGKDFLAVQSGQSRPANTPEAVLTIDIPSGPADGADVITVPSTDSILTERDNEAHLARIAVLPTPKVVQVLERMEIPAIRLNSPIAQAPIKDGQWQVPRFEVGYLEGTGKPGEPGNMGFTGHVDSIASGEVFANINKLKEGDEIQIYTNTTGDHPLSYRVRSVYVVKNNDLSPLQARDLPSLTLITCTGDFNVLTRDFDKRLIVSADLQ